MSWSTIGTGAGVAVGGGVRKVARVGMTAHGLPGVHGASLVHYRTTRRVGDTLRTQTVDPWGGKDEMHSGLSHRMVTTDVHYEAAPKTAKARATQQRALISRGLRKRGGRAE